MLDEANVRHVFYRILEKATVRRIRFHDLRHTFASLMIRQGESPTYVRDQLGHKSIQITVVYGHLMPGVNRSAVDRLDDAQPEAAVGHTEKAVSRSGRMVTLTFASWNRVGEWLRRFDTLRQAG